MKSLCKAFIGIIFLSWVTLLQTQVFSTDPSSADRSEQSSAFSHSGTIPVTQTDIHNLPLTAGLSQGEVVLGGVTFSAPVHYPMGMWGVGREPGDLGEAKRLELIGSLGFTIIIDHQTKSICFKALEQYPHLKVGASSISSYPSGDIDVTPYCKGGFYKSTASLCERYPAQCDADSLAWWLYLADVCTDTITHYASQLEIGVFQVSSGDFNTHWYRLRTYPGLDKMCELLSEKKSSIPIFAYNESWGFPYLLVPSTMRREWGWIRETRGNLRDTRLKNTDHKGLDIASSIIGSGGDLDCLWETGPWWIELAYGGLKGYRNLLDKNRNIQYWPQLTGTAKNPNNPDEHHPNKMRYQTCAFYMALCAGLQGFTFYKYPHLLDGSGKPYIDIEGSNSYLSDTLDMIFGVDRLMTTEDVNYTDGDRFYLDMWYFYDEMKKFGPILKSARWMTGDTNACLEIKEVNDNQGGDYQVAIFVKGGAFSDAPRHYLIVNRQLGLNDTREVTIKFEINTEENQLTFWDIYNNSPTIVNGSNGVFYYTITIPPGRARLIKVEGIVQDLFAGGDHCLFGNNGRKIAVDERTGLVHVCLRNDRSKNVEGWGDDESRIEVWCTVDDGNSWLGGWEIAKKTGQLGDLQTPAMALDPMGNPYVVYVDTSVAGGQLFCSNIFGQKIWLVNHVSSPSFVIDSKGYGHVTYISFNSSIVYMKFRLPGTTDPGIEDGSKVFIDRIDRGKNWPCISVNLSDVILVVYEKDHKMYCRASYSPSKGKNVGTWTKPVLLDENITQSDPCFPTVDCEGNYFYVTYRSELLKYTVLTVRPSWEWYPIPKVTFETIDNWYPVYPFIVKARAIVLNHHMSNDPIEVFARFKSQLGWSDEITISNSSYGCKNPQAAISYTKGKFYILWGEAVSYNRKIELLVYDFSNIAGWSNIMVQEPNGGEFYKLGEKATIEWSISGPLEDLTGLSSCNIYYNPWFYDNPNDWRLVGTKSGVNGPGSYSYFWRAGCYGNDEGEAGDEAKIKVVTNIGLLDISDTTFMVDWPCASLGVMGDLPISQPYEQQSISYKGTSWQGWEGVELSFSSDGGGSWGEAQFFSMSQYPPEDSVLIDSLEVNSGSTKDTIYQWEYVGTVPWTTPNTPTSGGVLKLTVSDTLNDTISDETDNYMIIPLPGGYEKSTYCNQPIMDLAGDSSGIGIVYGGYHPDSDSGKYVIYYTETDDAYALSLPDSVAFGIYPSYTCGATAWLSEGQTSVVYSYWNSSQFSSPSVIDAASPSPDITIFSPPCITNDYDTIHVLSERKALYQSCNETRYVLEHCKFLRTSPTFVTIDTVANLTLQGVLDTNESNVSSVAAQNGKLHIAFKFLDTCYYAINIPFMHYNYTVSKAGEGLYPNVATTEGNIIYSYLSKDSTKLIRMWRYRDDTTLFWAEVDTFAIGDTCDFMSVTDGLFYSLQARASFPDTTDTIISTQIAATRTFIFDPIDETIYPHGSYPAESFLHSYINPADDFERVDAYTGSIYGYHFLKTEKKILYAMVPALYMESKPTPSPYTLYRGSYVEYDECTIDYDRDSLRYGFNHLNSGEDYVLMLEFYYEADSSTTLLIQVNSNVDTLQIPAGYYSWYDIALPSSTSNVSVKLTRISGEFVPLSRLIIRRADESGMLFSSGIEELKPVITPFCLYQPFPNPFADVAMIRYSLPYATHVSLKVYDVSGRMVTKLVDGEVAPGMHELRWEGQDDINRRCASGVYFVRFKADAYEASKKIVMLK